MQSSEEIVVTIHDGEVQVAVTGCKGASCADLTKQLEAALGSKTEDKLTNEYYEREQRTRQNARNSY